MEEISNTKSHKLILTNRKNANFTGLAIRTTAHATATFAV